MRARVTRPYERPYRDPIAAPAGAVVVPDFERPTDIDGWAWCTGPDGRAGWTPLAWLVQDGGTWRLARDYDAGELTVAVGETLELGAYESGFWWAVNGRGEAGWVPAGHVDASPDR